MDQWIKGLSAKRDARLLRLKAFVKYNEEKKYVITLVDKPQKEPISTIGAELGKFRITKSTESTFPRSSIPALAEVSQVK